MKLPCRLVPVDSSRHMLWASMGIDIPGKTSRDLIRIINGVGSGYAVSTPAELDYIAHIARETAVVLDPVYTGKAALAMVRDLEAVHDEPMRVRVLFIHVHTGGMLGMFDKINALASLPSLRNKCTRVGLSDEEYDVRYGNFNASLHT